MTLYDMQIAVDTSIKQHTSAGPPQGVPVGKVPRAFRFFDWAVSGQSWAVLEHLGNLLGGLGVSWGVMHRLGSFVAQYGSLRALLGFLTFAYAYIVCEISV